MGLNSNVSIVDLLTKSVTTAGDVIAQIYGYRSTTYRQLNGLSDQVAHGLLAEGSAPGTRIAVIAKNSDLQCELLFGAAKAACVLVLINWRLTAQEIAYILRHSQATLVLAEQQFAGVVEEAMSQLGKKLRKLILDGGDANDSYSQWRDSQDARVVAPHLADESLVQLYTSGTTGCPKGVVITHRNVLAMIDQAISAGWGKWEEPVKQLICMPLFHVGGLSLLLIALAQGCTSVILAEANTGEITKAISRHKIQKMFLVPSVLGALCKHVDACPSSFSSLDLILYGASPITDTLLLRLRQRLRCAFAQLYGMTELTGAAVCLAPDDHTPKRGKLRSCGRAHPGVQIRVVDSSGQEAPIASLGEICIKAESVMKEYWRDQRATAEAIRDGWLYTGDAGYLDAEGYLFIHDRVKDMIISGGENIYPAEVENAIAAHPSVEEVAVIGVPDDEWGESVKAVAVIRPGFELSREELTQFLEGRIARYKMPRSLECVTTLPKTSSGKVMKRKLQAPYWAGKLRNVN